MDANTQNETKTLAEMLQEDGYKAHWAAFYSQLVEAVPGLKSSKNYVFQFTNPEKTASWYTGDAEAVFDLADMKPAAHPYYGPGIQRISQNFGNFLRAYKPKEGDRKFKLIVDRYYKALANGFDVHMSGDLKSDYERWKHGQGLNKVSVSVSQNTKIINEWHVAGDVKTSGDKGIVSFYLDGKGQALDEKLIDNKYGLKVSWDAITQYTIQRGPWYDGGYLNIAKSTNSYVNLNFSSQKFFAEDDPNALLNLIPVAVVVGYNPTYELTISNTNYQNFQVDVEAKGNLTIGPVKINASVEFHMKKENKENNTVTLTYKSKSGLPVNLGVFSVANTVK